MGTKNRFADNHLQLNLAGFYQDYSGYQASQPTAVIAGAASGIFNLGSAKIYGLEGQFIAQGGGARFDLNGTYLHAKFDDGAGIVVTPIAPTTAPCLDARAGVLGKPQQGRERSMRRSGIRTIVATLLAWLGAGAAHAAPAIDCPLRDAGYSVDAPLVDVLLKSEAKAALIAAMPDFARGLPADFSRTTAPTFAAILTPRTAAAFQHEPSGILGPLDARLRALKTTAADRTARCARYDVAMPPLSPPPGRPRLLLFEKMTGFRDAPSVEAAHAAFVALARQRGWSLVATDKAGVMTTASLARFDAVIWNNVSGDVLTTRQRRAFRSYIEGGGGFVGVHGSAGDPVYFWDWYADAVIGARFTGHPMNPQFQRARIRVEPGTSGIGTGLPSDWAMTDEWYSFRASPRLAGARIVATLDEASYTPTGMGGEDLRMGDHPIAWTRCVGRGRAFYSAIGHRPESYGDPTYLRMLEQAIGWASDRSAPGCASDAKRTGRDRRL